MDLRKNNFTYIEDDFLNDIDFLVENTTGELNEAVHNVYKFSKELLKENEILQSKVEDLETEVYNLSGPHYDACDDLGY